MAPNLQAISRRTADVDFAAGDTACNALLNAGLNCRGGSKTDADEHIRYWTSFGFFITVEVLSLGGDFDQNMDSMQEIDQGFVASISDLLPLQAITVEERGDSRDTEDFASLVDLAIARGLTLRELEEEMSRIVWAGMKMEEDLEIEARAAWKRMGVRGRTEETNVVLL